VAHALLQIIPYDHDTWKKETLTWQEVARFGEAAFRKIRCVGDGTINHLKVLCLEQGCALLP